MTISINDYKNKIELFDIGSKPNCSLPYHTLQRTRSVPIMSRFYSHSSVERIDALYIENFFIGSSLVLIKSPLEGLGVYPCGSCTMTQFKAKDIFEIRRLFRDLFAESLPLQLSNGKTLNLWPTPYRIQAQTDADTIYGDKWHGNKLVHEGNRYGDTTNFYIVGSVDMERK